MTLDVFRFYHRILGHPYARHAKDAPDAIKGLRGRYSFLSNFYTSPYTLEGQSFFAVEQGYMWEKDKDPKYRALVLEATTARRCKHLGYKAKLPPKWDEKLRYDAMFKHVDAKFAAGTYMAERLIATELAYLEETNYHGDTHWGVDGRTGEGEGHLGRILMCVRYKRVMELMETKQNARSR